MTIQAEELLQAFHFRLPANISILIKKSLIRIFKLS